MTFFYILLMKKIVTVVFLIALIPGVGAATLKGNVYDFSLEPITAVIQINTTPTQQIVADGEYSLEVPPGSYKLVAQQKKGGKTIAAAKENVTIKNNGTFNLDLILFPEVDVNESLDIEGPGFEDEEFNYWKPLNQALPYLTAISLLLILWGLHYSHKRHMEEQATQEWEEELELDDDARKILEFIDREKRVTQKEIRERFSYSQSKISLIITELEDKGLVRKIKRGRGNVIIRN